MSDPVHKYCNELPGDHPDCCGSCHEDEHDGYSELNEREDGNTIWHVCCANVDYVDEMIQKRSKP